MNLNYGVLKQFGFKSKNLWEPTNRTIGLFLKKCGNDFVFVNTLTPGTIGVFELTDEERALYEDNNLTLVPPGCCAPASYSMGRSIKEDCRIIYSGEVKSRKHLSALLEGYLDD